MNAGPRVIPEHGREVDCPEFVRELLIIHMGRRELLPYIALDARTEILKLN